jgi:hypothetical protein
VTEAQQQQNDLWRQAGWPSVEEAISDDEKRLLRKKQMIEAGLRTADGLLGLMNHPSYKVFTESLDDMKRYRIAQLLGAKNEHELVTMKGRCLELQAVLDMVSNVKFNKNQLEEQLGQVENELSALRLPELEPQPQPTEEQA